MKIRQNGQISCTSALNCQKIKNYPQFDWGLNKNILLSSLFVVLIGGFLLPNTSSKETLESYVYSIDSLEHVVGIDIFHHKNEEWQRGLESSITKAMWDW